MKFNFEVPEPLQLSAPVSYYENLLSDYRYLDISCLGIGRTGQIFGKCEMGASTTTLRALKTTD